jgi:hypothetical protein
MFALLDLNFTLAKVLYNDKRPLSVRIPQETYRAWIPKLLARNEATVVITTARPESAMEATLARIKDQLDWEPDDAFFSQTPDGMPHHKKHDNLRRIVDKYGEPNAEELWFGLESNPRTRAMYLEYGIDSQPVPRESYWRKLPEFSAYEPTRSFAAEANLPFSLPS